MGVSGCSSAGAAGQAVRVGRGGVPKCGAGSRLGVAVSSCVPSAVG